ncbi:DUF4328 domain-containing protein [Lentzea cavernae]|uniref:DUF4328 domain-containing protein n=1 Tax=Lentzea cavernae TaxID=2020703 RepID=A0ABQ3M2D4_9PSEU|nr:DUF4328 domain-containing protein [Lentzea cavernae]GHH30116.1 hypothetical protein GCM10017774_07230 [Lentzea cavernae]
MNRGKNAQRFRSVRGLGLVASVLIGLVALGNVAEAAADWLTYTTIRDYRAHDTTPAELATHYTVRVLTNWPPAVITAAAITAFIMWLHNARINAGHLVPAGERLRDPVWVWLSWCVPVVNLWFPKVVVDDVWRASDPRLRDVPLEERPSPATTTRWWTAFVLMWLLDLVHVQSFQDGDISNGWYAFAAVQTTICAAVGIVAAVLAARVVRQISSFQSTP